MTPLALADRVWVKVVATSLEQKLLLGWGGAGVGGGARNSAKHQWRLSAASNGGDTRLLAEDAVADLLHTSPLCEQGQNGQPPVFPVMKGKGDRLVPQLKHNKACLQQTQDVTRTQLSHESHSTRGTQYCTTCGPT